MITRGVRRIELPDNTSWESLGPGRWVRHGGQGDIRIDQTTREHQEGFNWWVSVPSRGALCQGREPTLQRAKFRAMLVYLALGREFLT